MNCDKNLGEPSNGLLLLLVLLEDRRLVAFPPGGWQAALDVVFLP